MAFVRFDPAADPPRGRFLRLAGAASRRKSSGTIDGTVAFTCMANIGRKRNLGGLLVISLGVIWAGAALATDQVPQLDVGPSCRAAAERSKSNDYIKACVQDELRARDNMRKSWAEFKPADQSHCVQLSRMGGKGTYTELLTCLEMARDARKLNEANQEPLKPGQVNKSPVTTGQAPK
jgi:hypothetical protein